MSVTVLITSVGSLVGQNLLDSLQDRRKRLRIVGTNSIVSAANNYRCNKSYLVPPAIQTKDYQSALSGIIERENPSVIIPGRDDDIVILGQLRESTPDHEKNYMIGGTGFAAAMDDKVRSYAFAQRHGLPFAPTLASGTQQAALFKEMVLQFGFPLIAKPRTGNGSRGIWIVTNQQQLENVIAEPGFAVQPLFGNSADVALETHFGVPFVWEVPESALYAAQVLICPAGNIIKSIGFVSKMVGGKCEQLDRCADPDLMEITERFAVAAVGEGWRGPFNLQLKKDNVHGFMAIEMNGRFSGGTSARYHLGFDEVGILINQWVGQSVVEDRSEKTGIDTINKVLCDFPLRSSNIQQLRKYGYWPGDR